MALVWCKKCGGCMFKSQGKCPCKAFKIINEEDEEHTVFSTGIHEAALKYAKQFNISYDYLMEESVEIRVEGKKFRLSAKPVINYSAEEIKDESNI